MAGHMAKYKVSYRGTDVIVDSFCEAHACGLVYSAIRNDAYHIKIKELSAICVDERTLFDYIWSRDENGVKRHVEMFNVDIKDYYNNCGSRIDRNFLKWVFKKELTED